MSGRALERKSRRQGTVVMRKPVQEAKQIKFGRRLRT